MLRILTFPLNISFTFIISLFFCSLNLSFFYKAPSLNDGMFILMIVLFFLFSSILMPYKPYYSRHYYNNDKIWKIFFYFSAVGFMVEFILFGVPILQPGGRENYVGIPFVHVAFYSSVIISVLMSSVYSNRKAVAICLTYSLVISTILMSRQMIMICFPIVFISILTRNRLTLRHWVFMLFGVVLLLLLFGLIGNIRQQLAGDYFEGYIIKVGGANESGQSLGQSLYWVWLYIASPAYNLLLNYNNYYEFGSSCDLSITYGSCRGDFFSSTILPEIFIKYTTGNEFIEDLQISYLNVSTGFAKSARVMGAWGVILQCICAVAFYIIGCLLTPKRYREAFRVYFSTLSFYMCFDNKFIRTEFFFGFILIFSCIIFASVNSLTRALPKLVLTHKK